MAEVVSKRGRSRKPLATFSASDVNISAGTTGKENRDGASVVLSHFKSKRVASKAAVHPSTSERSLSDDIQEMQRRLELLSLEKEKTEELLRQRDEVLKQKEDELESRGREQERLEKEVKKLQKLKFNPIMSIPLVKSIREKEQEKKHNRKAKKNEDSQETKKPCTAYILWCKDQWSEIKKDNPDAGFKEISAILGAKWKNVSAKDKKPYEEKYLQEKDAYMKIMGQEKREKDAMKLLEDEQMQKTAMELLEQYLEFKQGADNEGKKLRKEKDPLKPKKPMSAFFIYATERRAKLPQENKNICAIAKIVGEEWNRMTEEEKRPYQEIAHQRMEEYNKQMELYKQKKLDEAASLEKEEVEQKKIMKQEALQLLKKKEKTTTIIKKVKDHRRKAIKLKRAENSDLNKPKKPTSSFLLFSKETRKQLLQERSGMGKSTVAAVLSVKWKELSEGEKQMWNDKAAEGMAAYRKQMEEYNKSALKANNSSTDQKQ